MPDPAEQASADSHQKIVLGFRNPEDAWLSQARIERGDALVWGIFLARHARRASRNAHRVLIATKTALATRSEDAWGSHEAADVAKLRVGGPASALDQLLGKEPPPAETEPASPSGGSS
ncbi:MAG: hypothetical protein QOE90_2407 [Thermoplasmata archaeon]|jgi:hypothetical protein|nr:hypothetical protein [Thermoplasmata archaeon]